jgi:hypothetical protein
VSTEPDQIEHITARSESGLDVGRDNGLPVSPNKLFYLRRPFPFEGTVEKIVFEVQ